MKSAIKILLVVFLCVSIQGCSTDVKKITTKKLTAAMQSQAITPTMIPADESKFSEIEKFSISVFTTTETSDLELYKFAFDIAGKQKDFKNRLMPDETMTETVLFANPEIFNDLSKADRAEMLKYVEAKAGRKILLKTHKELVSEGYADYSRKGMFGFIDGKYSEFSMERYKTESEQNARFYEVSFFTGPLAFIGCPILANYVDGKWQVEDNISINIS